MAAGQADVGEDDEVPDLVDTDVESDCEDDCTNKQPNTPQPPSPAFPGSQDPKPKWLAVFFVNVGKRRLPILGDSGCTGSCMSYDYFQRNPYLKQSFVPFKSRGTAINGSGVPLVKWS